MKRTISTLVGGLAAAALTTSTLVGAVPAASAAGPTPQALAVTPDGRLISFRVDRPKQARVIGAITGLSGDTALIGLDYRPADRKLYAVGNAGGVYVVKGRTGNVTKVSQLTVALEGSQFGVDFNPAADRLRVISNTGQNLRHEVTATGVTVEDGDLNTPPAEGATTGLTGAAYTNNDTSADTGTLLFDIDAALDQVVAQVPANAGTLSPVGKLGVDTAPEVAFDIFSEVEGDRAVRNTGYAILKTGPRRKLYSVDLSSGRATLISQFRTGLGPSDIAVKLDR